MAFCGKCGSQLHENATFCANCGAGVGGAAQTPAGGTPAVTQTYVAPAGVVYHEHAKGFFGSLFDISFTSFITSKIIKFLYVLLMIVLAVAIIVFVVAAQNQQSPVPLLAIIAAPIAFFLYLILIRVQLELIIVIFRMSEHLGEIADQGRKKD